MLDHEDLKSRLHYDPATGVFRWRLFTPRRAKPGVPAGHTESNGYRRIGIDGVRHFAHRLAWFYMTGEMPNSDVDHKNRNRDDNRWENLRLASRRGNVANSRVAKNNKLGVKGVKETPYGRFMTSIKIEGKAKYLGTFATPEEAHDAYMTAARQLHGEFAHDGSL